MSLVGIQLVEVDIGAGKYLQPESRVFKTYGSCPFQKSQITTQKQSRDHAHIKFYRETQEKQANGIGQVDNGDL